MADAIIALASNQAFREQKRLPFPEEWFRGEGHVPEWDLEIERTLQIG
jgi:hypothetical protein